MSHVPILQNNIILFDFFPRHYVKVVTDDSAESRMLIVIMNILIINKQKLETTAWESC